MRSFANFSCAFCCAAATFFANLTPAVADPCGMVPPVYAGRQIPITRIGEQKTYVFYKQGVETIVLQPGFSGKVDEFGMLIPFPTPPAIRKMPDNVFQQIAAAIDPPEVVIDLTPIVTFGGSFGGGGFGGGGLGSGSGGLGFELKKDEVRVVREEAVGMYEVAVLAAGSAAALKRWIDDHKYVYPEGMDAVCEDYVDLGWCFVAVKTKVKQKSAADPKPGMRKVDNALPNGASFDGTVQAMGFRFRSKKLVVPMRLSAFNPGELRNIVYLLADDPARIRMIPEEYVVRQVSGEQLYKNLTALLPVRVIGGTPSDVPAGRIRQLKAQRDPKPHNGVAGELFASDFVAARTGELLSEQEKQEKELQLISERFDLRGDDIDKHITAAIDKKHERFTRASLRGLRGMTLTVIDGDFPRETIAKDNLTFASYRMPPQKNRANFYDAKMMGPAGERSGTVVLGEFKFSGETETLIASANAAIPSRNKQTGFLLLFAPGAVFFALVATWTWRRRK